MPSSKPRSTPPRKTLSATLTGLVAVGCTLALTAPTTATAADQPTPSEHATGERAPGTGTARHPRHSSDGVAGTIAEPQPTVAARRAVRVRNETGWNMAPGIDYRTWEQVDGRRSPVRVHLVTVDTANPGNTFDLLSMRKVAATGTIHSMAEKAAAVAAVNGDFFDIGDTGAPLGVGRARKEGLRHAPAEGWNSAFWIDKGGRPHVGELPFSGSFHKKHPRIEITNFNSPVVAEHGVGVYTSAWGRTRGASVVNGQKRVRQVILKKGRVVSNRYGLSTGKKVKGKLLVGRGRSATLLKKLERGERLRLRWRVRHAPQVAIGGDRPLLLDGQRVVINDQVQHPRTAVGIDEDGHKVFLLAIDGRSAVSRGYTMVELANMMLALGAEDALNLDGGGSTTMVGHTDAGVLGVLNTPSDGTQRRVPNGLGVFSDPFS